jgi:hypothetical protein
MQYCIALSKCKFRPLGLVHTVVILCLLLVHANSVNTIGWTQCTIGTNALGLVHIPVVGACECHGIAYCTFLASASQPETGIPSMQYFVATSKCQYCILQNVQ